MEYDEHPLDKATQAAREMGLDYKEARSRAQEFIRSIREDVEGNPTPDVEIQINSLDKTAGEIIIRIHETSDRAPEDVLERVIKSHGKDPKRWGVITKLKKTGSSGFTNYKAEPTRNVPKSSDSSGPSSSPIPSDEDLEDMDADEAGKLLEQLLAKKNEE